MEFGPYCFGSILRLYRRQYPLRCGTFDGSVVLNGSVILDALETERMLAKVTACSCIPLIITFNTTVKQKAYGVQYFQACRWKAS